MAGSDPAGRNIFFGCPIRATPSYLLTNRNILLHPSLIYGCKMAEKTMRRICPGLIDTDPWQERRNIDKNQRPTLSSNHPDRTLRGARLAERESRLMVREIPEPLIPNGTGRFREPLAHYTKNLGKNLGKHLGRNHEI